MTDEQVEQRDARRRRLLPWVLAAGAMCFAAAVVLVAIIVVGSRDQVDQQQQRADVAESSVQEVQSSAESVGTVAAAATAIAGNDRELLAEFLEACRGRVTAPEMEAACRRAQVQPLQPLPTVDGTATPPVVTRVRVEPGQTWSETRTRVVTTGQTVTERGPTVTDQVAVTVPVATTVRPPAVEVTVTKPTTIFESIILRSTETMQGPTTTETAAGPTVTETTATTATETTPVTTTGTVTETERATETPPAVTVTETPAPVTVTERVTDTTTATTTTTSTVTVTATAEPTVEPTVPTIPTDTGG